MPTAQQQAGQRQSQASRRVAVRGESHKGPRCEPAECRLKSGKKIAPFNIKELKPDISSLGAVRMSSLLSKLLNGRSALDARACRLLTN